MYEYNDSGIRTSKEVNGVKHIYALNGSQIVTESWVQSSAGNDVEHVIVYLYDESGAPIGMQYRTSNYAWGEFDNFYFEKNLFGDVVAIYNESGTKIGSYTYDAWGVCTASFESTASTLEEKIVRTLNPFRYRGYYYDTETGLYYLQSRYYNPYWGRFINADGISYLGETGDIFSYNLYAYCGNNPVTNIDPSGHAWYDVVNTIFGLFGPNAPLSATTAIASVTWAVFNNGLGDIIDDAQNGCLNPFNQSEETALKAKVLSFYKGKTVVRQNIVSSFSIVGTLWLNSDADENTVRHEYGHSIQENVLGPYYWKRVAIPSVYYYIYDEFTKGDPYDYYSMPWERTAEWLGGASSSPNGYKDGSFAWGIAENLIGYGIIPFYLVFGY